MPSRRLHELDRSSTRFSKQLDELLHDRVWVESLQLLPEGGLSELMGYLNTVRSISTPIRSHSSSPQIFDGLDPMDSSYRKCLHVLQKICSSRMILPAMYEVSGTLSISTTQVVAYGGFCDVYRGSLGASDVCIKRLRVSATCDRAMVKQVTHPHSFWPRCHALINFVGTLQGGRDVEAPESPKHCALQRCYLRPPPTRVRMDAWRRVERIYQE